MGLRREGDVLKSIDPVGKKGWVRMARAVALWDRTKNIRKMHFKPFWGPLDQLYGRGIK